MSCEPANSVISRLGGLTKVAGMCGVNVSTVQRWRMPRDRGGTGGSIPHWHAYRIMEAAAKDGVAISAADFLPLPNESAPATSPDTERAA